MLQNIMLQMEEKIHKLMEENHIMGEIVDCDKWLRMIAVEVRWGDWKHEHARLNWLVKENFPSLRSVHEVTTEDDGSDCYSAIHYYYFGV